MDLKVMVHSLQFVEKISFYFSVLLISSYHGLQLNYTVQLSSTVTSTHVSESKPNNAVY